LLHHHISHHTTIIKTWIITIEGEILKLAAVRKVVIEWKPELYLPKNVDYR